MASAFGEKDMLEATAVSSTTEAEGSDFFVTMAVIGSSIVYNLQFDVQRSISV